MSSSTQAPPSYSRTGRTFERGTLTSHRVLRFAGPDAAAFLQGYLTCDTNKLSEQHASPGAFTNLKGRVVANGWVWGSASEVLILVSADLTQTIGDFLKMYLNFTKTTLSIAPHPPEVQLSRAPTAAAGAETTAEATLESASEGAKGQDHVQLGAGRTLLSNGFKEATTAQDDLSTAWLSHSINQLEILTTETTSGTLLPQMLGLIDLGAVSFDKGCYLGQEVVARAQHRGEVKRRLRHIEYRAAQSLPAGATLEDPTGKRVAVVINATAHRTHNDPDSAATNAATHAALIVTAVDELAGLAWSYAETPVQLL